MKLPKSKLLKALPIIIVLIGILARTNVYVHNRSLFIDEANLARNIVEKSLPEYFNSLDYEQYAPPLFLVETKIVTAILGNRDYSFRVIPLLSGIGCLVLMWMFLKEWEEEAIGQIYALSLFSFSVLAIRYGTEFKQYSSDALLALLLVWLAWKDRDKRWEWSSVLFWIGLGVGVIWYSMPAVFVLSGVGLYFLFLQRGLQFGRWLSVVTCWVISFAAYYYFVLSKDVFDSNLQNHHAEYFVRLFTTSNEAWKTNGELVVTLFKSITDKTAVPVGFGMLTFLMGLFAFYKQNKALLVLFSVPVLALLLVSNFQLYSFIPRMTLFILPLMMLVMARGLSFLWQLDILFIKVLLVGLVTLSVINKEGYKHVYLPIEIENIKLSLKMLQKEIDPTDQIYVHHEAVPAFTFYNSLSDKPFHFSRVYLADWKMPPLKFLNNQDNGSNYWIVFSHSTQGRILKAMNSIDAIGTAELFHEDSNSAIYRFSMN